MAEPAPEAEVPAAHHHPPAEVAKEPDQPQGTRDPHAWSDGLQYGEGPYALAAPLHLHDDIVLWKWRADRLEWGRGEDSHAAFDGLVDVGKTFSGGRLKAEGEAEDGSATHHRLELVYRKAVAPFWDLQAGLRHDGGDAASRTWGGIGLQGLAPYWFEVDVSAWLGDSGRTAFTLEAEYELLLTQRWVLQPRVELDAYGRDDPEAGVGSGLSDAAAGVRLRYEITRQFAPYIGWEWSGQFGGTADLAAEAGMPRRDSRWLVGLRMWY